MAPSDNMQTTRTLTGLISLPLLLGSGTVLAADVTATLPPMTVHWSGYLALAIFIFAILLASLEEHTQLRKSKPVVVAAGIIWALIGWYAMATGNSVEAEENIRENLLHYVELMLLMLVVMTYINALGERRVFKTLRAWVGNRGLSYRGLFWSSGIITFMLSPFLDNLASAMLVGALVVAMDPTNRRFISLGCLNVVIAANAGGAFSPFGDITTLIIWQKNIHASNGVLDFWSFFNLFIPSLINFLIPACAMHFAVPKGRPETSLAPAGMLRGARRIMGLFFCTIATAVFFRGVLHLPAVIGMLTGLSYLQFFGYYLKKTYRYREGGVTDAEQLASPIPIDGKNPFDVFIRVARVEWDTLLFIYGVALSVGGLSYIGYLAITSDVMYNQWGHTPANIAVGLASSVLENIPTMYSVLAMMPDMSRGEWLLATLGVGTGGSLLAIGSAAGVALMAQSNGNYTFFSHLKWTPVILLAYIASVLTHLWLNARLF